MSLLSNDEIARYSRHLLLDGVGPAGQERLKAASVLCIGAGGLGSPVLLYLAAAGVGRIGLVDFDAVDVSNLQRQIAHGTASVGRKKVLSARDRILDLNPHVRVDVHDGALTSANALAILGSYDVIVDGTDNFPTRYLANDACVLLGIPYVYGAIFKFEGQTSVFNHAGGPNYRDLFPEPPPPGLVPTCAEGGVLGVLPGVIGAIQATEALKLLLGLGETLSGRLLVYDALAMRFQELALRKDPNAPPITRLVDYDQFCGVPHDAAPKEAPMYQSITAADLKRRRDEGWTPYVLDVRKPHEAEIANLPFIDRLEPHETVARIAAELPRDRDVVVMCRSGMRSARACEALAGLGFTRLFNLEGGILGWSASVDPSVPRY